MKHILNGLWVLGGGSIIRHIYKDTRDGRFGEKVLVLDDSSTIKYTEISRLNPHTIQA